MFLFMIFQLISIAISSLYQDEFSSFLNSAFFHSCSAIPYFDLLDVRVRVLMMMSTSKDDAVGPCTLPSMKIHTPTAKSLVVRAAHEMDAGNFVDNSSIGQVATDPHSLTGRAASERSVIVKHPPLPTPASPPSAVAVGPYNGRRGAFPVVGRVSAILNDKTGQPRRLHKWECFICQTAFNEESSLPMHIRAVHQFLWDAYEQQLYADVCSVCGELLSVPFNL